MTPVYKLLLQIKIRLGQWLSLIFFVCLFAGSCRQKESAISIVWNEKQATGIAIAKQLLSDELAEPPAGLQVRLKGNTDVMLGHYKSVNGRTIFTPLIPLSPGADYEVVYRNKLIGSVQIPAADAANAAYVLNVFPAVDTVPMNLLKIYVQFSAPMREGEALQHIHLVNEQNDTVPNVFLDLQPELWDEKREVLTVWLDPGRIKRDLIPNRQMGNPLQPGKRYRIVVANNWKDGHGLPLRQSFNKTFVTGTRDSVSPQLSQWKLQLPAAKTIEKLDISFGESLDYFLLPETITITGENGNVIKGKSGPLSNGTGFAFRPEKPWQPGRYHLKVATHLEDLAGNNLNRLFDQDINAKRAVTDAAFMESIFVIKSIHSNPN